MPKGIPASGSRKKGAGRKKGNKEPTTTIAFRVPVSQQTEIKVMITTYLNKVKNQASVI